jgi:hypothetical protein
MSDVVKLNKSILGLTGTIENFIASMGKMDKATDTAKKKITELTKAQALLGIELKNGELFSIKTKNRVNAVGEEITKTGEKMLGFNKRSSILTESIKELNKTNQRFNLGMASFTEYTQRGGNSLEYLAEFISGSREEITIFGIEAAKARKVMYGYLPPGMFRLLNKFSSVLQLVGGSYRKIASDGKAGREEIKKLKEAIEVASSPEELEALQKRLEDLEVPDNLFTNMFKGAKKVKKTINKFITEPLTEGMERGSGFGDKLSKIFPNALKLSKNFFKMVTFKTQIKNLNKLRKETGKYMKAVKKGGSITDKTINKAQKKLDDINTTLSGFGMDKLKQQSENFAKTEEKRNAALEKHQQRIEQLEESKKGKSNSQLKLIDSQIAKAQVHIATIEATAEKQQEVNDQLEEGLALQEKQKKQEEKLISLKAMQKGTKNLKKEIKDGEKAIKKRLKIELEAENLIEAKKKQVIALKDAEAMYSARKLDTSLTPQEQIQASIREDEARTKRKEVEAELPDLETGLAGFKEDTKDKQTSLKNSKEQLKVLKTQSKESLKKMLTKHPFFSLVFKIAKGIQTLVPLLGIVLRSLAKYFILAFLALAAIIVVIRKIGPMVMEAFSKAFETAMILKDFIMQGFDRVKGGLGKMFSFIFGGGTLEDFINGGLEVLLGLVEMALGVLGVLALLVVGFVIEFGKIVFKTVKNKIKEFITNSKKLTKFIIGIVAAIGIIVALVMGAPILVAVAIGVIIYKVGMKLLKPLTTAVKLVKDIVLYIYAGIALIIQSAINAIITGLNYLPRVDIKKKTFGDKAMEYYNKSVVGNRQGGVSDGRMTVVGEGGRELMFMPKGGRIVSNAETEKIIGNKQPTTNNFNITINAKDSSQTEMRRIADMIGRDIAAKINRTTSSSTLR